MDTRHLIDPELLPGLDMMPPFVFSEDSLPAIRQGFVEMIAAQPAIEGLPGTVEERSIKGADGQPMNVRVIRPDALPQRAAGILHIHGGGYVIGTASMSDIANRVLADELQCLIVSVDYRLAPDTPHPGPVEDCYAALRWMVDQTDALAIDPDRIAIKGESAGGGLAAALALLARDRGGPAICHQHLIYPMIDDRTGSHGDPHPHCGEFVWTAESNRFGWRSLLGKEPGSEGVPAYAAAARAEAVAGLPPTYIATGALDLFLEEDMEYARRLLRAGVPTELHVWPGAYHGFEVAPEAQVTKMAAEASSRALRRALAKG